MTDKPMTPERRKEIMDRYRGKGIGELLAEIGRLERDVAEERDREREDRSGLRLGAALAKDFEQYGGDNGWFKNYLDRWRKVFLKHPAVQRAKEDGENNENEPEGS